MPATSHPGVRDAVPVELFLDCIHCGLCTSSCPTYLETGDENQGPRGRIYLMRAVSEGRLPLDDAVRTPLETCLDCRACETACPSGVQYGRIIEPFRVAMEETAVQAHWNGDPDQVALPSPKIDAGDWFRRWILFRLFPYPGRLGWSLFPARLLKRIGLFDVMTRPVAAVAPQRVRRLMELLPQQLPSEPALPERLPAIGPKRAKVALFRGCAADALFRQVHWATARVLQANGCEVWIPRDQACCGAIHYHAGSSDPARDFADANVAAFRREAVDAVVVNVAGCGSMVKDYGHHWHDAGSPDREALATKTRDIHEFLDELGLIEPTGSVELTATYHDACHLAHAQKIREAPRRLLSKIPGLKLVPLPESEVCCGAAGTYNLTQPEMSDRLGRRKRENIKKTGAEVVVSANAGCTLQIAKKLSPTDRPLPVLHPMELLDRSYAAGGAYGRARDRGTSVANGVDR